MIARILAWFRRPAKPAPFVPSIHRAPLNMKLLALHIGAATDGETTYYARLRGDA